MPRRKYEEGKLSQAIDGFIGKYLISNLLAFFLGAFDHLASNIKEGRCHYIDNCNRENFEVAFWDIKLQGVMMHHTNIQIELVV